MSSLANALSKLNTLYAAKKDQIKEEQVKQVEQQQQVQQPKTKEQPVKQEAAPNYNPKEKKSIRDEKTEKKRKQICLRKCAGDIWEDTTLADWPDNDYRLFCGNLGNEVSDEILAQAFRKYPSFARARVIRDRRTMKTKGYGFVSFLNPTDYLKAFNEQNGKYIGNRPVKITKGKWQEKSYQKKKKDELVGKFIKTKIGKIKRVNPTPP